MGTHITTIYDRNCRAFGAEGQQRLQELHIAVVGVGGHGFNLALMLAHLGVGQLSVIDHDTIESSNLNRLLSLGPRFIGINKVIAGKQCINRINPRIRVWAIPQTATHPESIAAIKDASLIVGASDSEDCRVFLNQIAVQYLKPFLDMGCGIRAGEDGKIDVAAGQLRFVIPGVTPCLLCIDGINLQRARQERLSNTELTSELQRGYVQGFNIPQPSVVSLNMSMCSLACSQILFFATGLQETSFYLYYDVLNNRLETIEADRRDDCVVCSAGGVLGRGDTVPLDTSSSNEEFNFPAVRNVRYEHTSEQA